MSAPIEELTNVVPQNVAYQIRGIEWVLRKSLLGAIRARPVRSTGDVEDYLRFCQGDATIEVLRVMFLDGSYRLIDDRIISVGDETSAQVPVRRITQAALNLGAFAVILIHNHPSGNAKPSREDIHMTNVVREALKRLDVVLLDHLIVTRDGITSIRQLQTN